jgi:hypothetical protein
MKPKILKYITLTFDKELTIQTNYPNVPIKSVQIRYGNLYSIVSFILRIFRHKRAKH